jgi:hypothetical protein
MRRCEGLKWIGKPGFPLRPIVLSQPGADGVKAEGFYLQQAVLPRPFVLCSQFIFFPNQDFPGIPVRKF